MAGLLESLGQGLQGAGAVLSSEVYQTQVHERANYMANALRALQLTKAKRALDADVRFSDFTAGLQPSAMTSEGLLDAAKKIPIDVLSESPKAQQFMQLVSQVQNREAAAQARKDAIQARYLQIEQMAEAARQRSEDRQLGIQERAAADRRHADLQRTMIGMRADALKQGLELRRDAAEERRQQREDALLTPQEATFMAGQYLAGDKSVFQNVGRGSQGAENIIRLRRAVQAEAERRKMKPDEIAARMAEFEGIKAGERTLGNRTANIEMAVTEAQQMAPLALTASENVDRTKIPTLNAALLAAEKGMGDENVVRLGVATNSLINIYARAISPTGVPTVSDKDHARELLASAWAKGQYRAGVDQLMKELQAARRAPGQVRSEFRSAVTGAEEKPKDTAAPAAPQPATASQIDELVKKYAK